MGGINAKEKRGRGDKTGIKKEFPNLFRDRNCRCETDRETSGHLSRPWRLLSTRMIDLRRKKAGNSLTRYYIADPLEEKRNFFLSNLLNNGFQ